MTKKKVNILNRWLVIATEHCELTEEPTIIGVYKSEKAAQNRKNAILRNSLKEFPEEYRHNDNCLLADAKTPESRDYGFVVCVKFVQIPY